MEGAKCEFCDMVDDAGRDPYTRVTTCHMCDRKACWGCQHVTDGGTSMCPDCYKKHDPDYEPS